MGEDDWLVIDGGNTHFWSEIAINIAGWKKKLGGILHPEHLYVRCRCFFCNFCKEIQIQIQM